MRTGRDEQHSSEEAASAVRGTWLMGRRKGSVGREFSWRLLAQFEQSWLILYSRFSAQVEGPKTAFCSKTPRKHCTCRQIHSKSLRNRSKSLEINQNHSEITQNHLKSLEISRDHSEITRNPWKPLEITRNTDNAALWSV